MKRLAASLLAPRGSGGLCCDEAGLALGPIALVSACRDDLGQRRYEAQPEAELRRALKHVDATLAVEAIDRCIKGIADIAAALNTGEGWRARFIAVQLGLPVITLDMMRMLAEEANLAPKVIDPGLTWDSSKHPRWPSGQSDGGRFRPNDGGGGGNQALPILPVAANTRKPQAKPSPKPRPKSKSPNTPPSTAWKNYPNPEMREKLAQFESSANRPNNGYAEETKDGKAIGRYQFRKKALIDAGWKNKDGSWTEKAKEAGVTKDSEFLANPDAQEKALTDLL